MGESLLILGGSGFLGAHLVRASKRLWPHGCSFWASRQPVGHPNARTWDALEPGATGALLDELEPRVVISAAALARAADCERGPARALALNAHFPGRLARLTRERGIRLLHISTDLVFGGRPPLGERYSEADPVSPLGTYGESKAAGEQAALAEGALVVRLPLLFGDSLGRACGPTDGLLAALQRGERPGLFTDEWRTPLDVTSAAGALLELAQGEQRGLLHVAGSERLSRHELGCRVLRAAGLGAQVPQLGAVERAELGLQARAGDVCLDARRARGLLECELRGSP